MKSKLVFEKLEEEGIKDNIKLFDFAFDNDKEAALEFISGTANSENISILSQSNNEEILLNLYDNKNISSDTQQEIEQKIDTNTIVFHGFEKKPEQERLNQFINNEPDAALLFATKCKNPKLFDMFPKNDSFSLALSKNRNLTPEAEQKVRKYANNKDKIENPTLKDLEVKKQILKNLAENNKNKAVPEEKNKGILESAGDTLSNVADQLGREEITQQFLNNAKKAMNMSAAIDSFFKKKESPMTKSNKDKEKTISRGYSK